MNRISFALRSHGNCNLSGLAFNRSLHSSVPRYFPSFTDFNPDNLSGKNPIKLYNLVNGEWKSTSAYMDIVDPMKDGEIIIKSPDTSISEIQPFLDSLASCPRTGLHNPFKNVQRYAMLGEVSHKAAVELEKEIHFFSRAIQRVMPKSYAQAYGEVAVVVQFLKNFGGDNVKFLSNDSGIPGDRDGQFPRGYRWPYGPVSIIAPFNFPLEIPVLQLMGALYMGNKPIIKSHEKVGVVLEMFIRLLHQCGLPKTDVDMIHSRGPVMQSLIEKSNIRLTQFTGSSKVAELLSKVTNGKIKIEDAGFDWKILGPDGADNVDNLNYVAYQCDQDAYACSGQKCSAQSILFAHENWVEAGLLDQIANLASTRNLKDLTIGPVLSWTTNDILAHVEKLLKIPGSRVLFGGQELKNHTIPSIYAAIEPTAVFVPFEEMIKNDANFNLCTTEIFGPFQIVTSYTNENLPDVLSACERMNHHLTAAVVSNDLVFQNKVLGHTVNGTTYAGIRARTTGAPQSHWFGPAGDVRGAGIGTPGAIKMVWSCHREIVSDVNTPEHNWKRPAQS